MADVAAVARLASRVLPALQPRARPWSCPLCRRGCKSDGRERKGAGEGSPARGRQTLVARGRAGSLRMELAAGTRPSCKWLSAGERVATAVTAYAS